MLLQLGRANHNICLLDYDRTHTGQILLGFLWLLLAYFLQCHSRIPFLAILSTIGATFFAVRVIVDPSKLCAVTFGAVIVVVIVSATIFTLAYPTTFFIITSNICRFWWLVNPWTGIPVVSRPSDNLSCNRIELAVFPFTKEGLACGCDILLCLVLNLRGVQGVLGLDDVDGYNGDTHSYKHQADIAVNCTSFGLVPSHSLLVGTAVISRSALGPARGSSCRQPLSAYLWCIHRRSMDRMEVSTSSACRNRFNMTDSGIQIYCAWKYREMLSLSSRTISSQSTTHYVTSTTVGV